ncbi:MAG TPA: hypothetical protein VNL94_06160 [Candidatus Binatia bacterium]|nr:hypothetical protein [Candidatus Binatia bacterium]
MSRGAARKRDSLRNLHHAEVEPRWFELERLLEPAGVPAGDAEPVVKEQADDRRRDDANAEPGDGA